MLYQWLKMKYVFLHLGWVHQVHIYCVTNVNINLEFIKPNKTLKPELRNVVEA